MYFNVPSRVYTELARPFPVDRIGIRKVKRKMKLAVRILRIDYIIAFRRLMIARAFLWPDRVTAK